MNLWGTLWRKCQMVAEKGLVGQRSCMQGVKWPVRERALAQPPELGMPEILNRVQQILASDQKS